MLIYVVSFLLIFLSFLIKIEKRRNVLNLLRLSVSSQEFILIPFSVRECQWKATCLMQFKLANTQKYKTICTNRIKMWLKRCSFVYYFYQGKKKTFYSKPPDNVSMVLPLLAVTIFIVTKLWLVPEERDPSKREIKVPSSPEILAKLLVSVVSSSAHPCAQLVYLLVTPLPELVPDTLPSMPSR